MTTVVTIEEIDAAVVSAETLEDTVVTDTAINEIAITADDTETVMQGTNQQYRFTFTDASGRVDLTASTVYYRWKQNQNDPNPPEISKDSGTPTEIEILAQAGDTLGQADVFLLPADTESLTPGVHYWDIWAVLADTTRHAKLPDEVFLVDAVTDL